MCRDARQYTHVSAILSDLVFLPAPSQRACMSAFPHLRDYYFSRSPYTCCSAYEGDYRETFLDGNRGNRSTVLDWNMEAVTGGAADGADGLEGGDPEQASEGWAVVCVAVLCCATVCFFSGAPCCGRGFTRCGRPPLQGGKKKRSCLCCTCAVKPADL